METEQNDTKLDALFAAARKSKHYEPTMEYGFETRLMARIRAGREVPGPYVLWAWRLMPLFVSLVVILGIWAYESGQAHDTDLGSIVTIGNEETMLVASLTGE